MCCSSGVAKSGTGRPELNLPLEEEQGPASRPPYCFLNVPPLSLHPLPSLIGSCFNLPIGTQEDKGG